MATRDLTGRTFGRLRVEGRAPPRLPRCSSRWWCVCTCGTRRDFPAFNLTNGHTKSCGCLQRESGPRNKVVMHERRVARALALFAAQGLPPPGA